MDFKFCTALSCVIKYQPTPKALLHYVDLFDQGKSIDQIWGGIFNVFSTYPSGTYAHLSDAFSSKRSTLFGLLVALAALTMACIGVFFTAMDQTVVVTALPPIVTDLNIGATKLDHAAWISVGNRWKSKCQKTGIICHWSTS